MLKFQDIEDAVIARLREELPYLGHVGPYQGELEGELQSLPVRFPAAFVIWRGSRYEWAGGSNHYETARFSVMLCSRDLRGREHAARGSGGRPGAYQMLEDVLSALSNQALGLRMERLRPLRASLRHLGKDAVLYELEFETGFIKTFEFPKEAS
jgi:phage gp37-like protein